MPAMPMQAEEQALARGAGNEGIEIRKDDSE